MNVEIGTETPIFLFWEYLFQIFGILSLQWVGAARESLNLVCVNALAGENFMSTMCFGDYKISE